MPRIRVLLLRAVVVSLLSVVAAQLSSAQDAADVNSRFIHVKLDNSRVRVFETVLQPGDKEQTHSHPASVIYVLAGGTTRSHAADGKTTETTLKAGDVIYRDPLTHWAENIGTTTIRLILVELKNQG